IGEGLLVAAIGIVADELEEEGNVMSKALIPDALDPGLLEIVDRGLLKGGVLEQHLDAVGSGFLEAAYAPHIEEVRQAAGSLSVVASLLIGQEETLAIAVLRGRETELGIEQDG